MNPAFIIARKRDGHELSADEIAYFVGGYANDAIPDYQMSALAMAIYLRGMTTSEIATLTEEMLNSGVQLKWDAGDRPPVDKHSTGGIGDKVSLILAPLLACCELQVPMISGRGLGATGGTLDKLESIPGFRTDLSIDEMQQISRSVGCVIAGASAELAPADKKLYALRDVTATVASIPLITASIMSKKLAEGLSALVLDVKFGSGAFMKTRVEAAQLAESLVRVGKHMGVRTSALITDMNQPLGRMVGNAVEVDESVAALKGNGPDDLMQVVFELGGEVLRLTAQVATRDEGVECMSRLIDSGEAMEKFRQMVESQGGDIDATRPLAPSSEVTAERAGCVQAVDAEKLGMAVITMGGGRKIKTDRIDHSVGFEMLVRVGDQVESGQSLMRVLSRPETREAASILLRDAVTIGDQAVDPLRLVVDVIE